VIIAEAAGAVTKYGAGAHANYHVFNTLLRPEPHEPSLYKVYVVKHYWNCNAQTYLL
jgi:hypothetical protein